jgi:uncharacterized protein (DUF3084 family)
MTTASYILVLAVLILGGVIATVGDRIGTRVGKARLSLFKLRPRRTATLVTILTGTLISASTFGILIAGSEQLRRAIFDFETIQRNVRRTRAELQQANQQKAQVQAELNKVSSDRATAKQQLAGTQQQLAEANQSLESAVAARAQSEAARAQSEAAREKSEAEAARIDTELGATRSQLSTVSQQTLNLRSDIEKLQGERSRVIAERNEEVRARDQVIVEREIRLRELESQQEKLAQEVLALEQEALGLRQGNVVIRRGKVLASAVVRVDSASVARQAIDRLLQEANRQAIQLVRPGESRQIIQITKMEVDQLIGQLVDGRDYLVRVFSAANYLSGETAIQVNSNVVRNKQIFEIGDTVAATSIDPSALSGEQIQQRINLLIATANFRARSLGILTEDSVDVGRIQNLVAFVEQLRQEKQMVTLKALAAETTFTAGPLKIELVAERNGLVLFRSKNPAPEMPKAPAA